MPELKGYKCLWNGLSPLYTKGWPGFLHIIFSCCDRTISTFLWELWRRRSSTKWWFGGQGSVHCLPWPDGPARVESRISAREHSKGRIKHTVCSSACVVLSLLDGWRVLYKQHHRSVSPEGFSNFRLCQSAPLFALQLLLKGIVVFTCHIKYVFSLSSFSPLIP